MTKTNFGQNLAHFLKVLGITQATFAEKSGLTQAAVSQIINGRREPSLDSILKILTVLPIKFEQLIGGENGKMEPR